MTLSTLLLEGVKSLLGMQTDEEVTLPFGQIRKVLPSWGAAHGT